ncbi:MFS general substrate transporter [Paramyrothecium foliicola]|nr:MFS general substrate transporter [Paramyrothecium foliicola]
MSTVHPDITAQGASAQIADIEMDATPVGAQQIKELDRFLVTFNGSNDFDNPQNWSRGRKWAVTDVLSATGFNRIMVSTIMAPALHVIAHELGMSSAESTMSLSIYVLASAFGPIIIGPLSEMHGRKPILHASSLWFLIWNVLCGFASTKELLIAARFMAGFGASAIYALAGGVLGDIWTPEERGNSLAIYLLIPLLGAAVGPIIGGFMANRTTWRWMFWSTSIFQAAMILVSMCSYWETYAPLILKRKAERLRRETGNLRYETELERRHPDAKKHYLRQVGHTLIRPVRLLLFHPIIQVMGVIQAFYYGLLYILLASFADVWTQEYQQSVEISGLHYIACASGEVVGALTGGRLMDFLFKHMRKRTVSDYGPEQRIPLTFVGSLVAPIGLFLYGWTVQHHAHWFWVDLGVFLTTFGMQVAGMPLQAYIMDAYPEHTTSALAASQFLKSLAAFLFPLFATKMYQSLGVDISPISRCCIWAWNSQPKDAEMANYRQLAPNPSGPAEKPPPPAIVPKRRLQPAACQACRARKIKVITGTIAMCDGGRPSCSQCSSRSIECVFSVQAGETRMGAMRRENDELRESSQTLAQLFELLQSAPEATSATAFQHIRRGLDPSAVLRALEQPLSNLPSPNQINRSLSPPTQSQIEFELAALFPNAYPFLIPLDVSTVNLALLSVSSAASIKPEQQIQGNRAGPSQVVPFSSSVPDPTSFNESSNTIDPTKLRTSELQPKRNKICDQRLHFVNISTWTNVPVTNAFAAEAISLYLETEHPVLGLFDVDSFINDLTSGRTRFCNRILVNALLSWACQIYTSLDPTAAYLSREFFAEAAETWRQRREPDDLPTLSGIIFMSLICNNTGQDKSGFIYLQESANMGRRLHLFDQSSAPPFEVNVMRRDPEYYAAAATVAWSVFNWHMAQHESAKHSILYHSGMMYLMNEMLHQGPTQESRFYFLLCMKGYKYLARCLPMVDGIVQSILQIAIQKGAVLPLEALAVFKEVYTESLRLLRNKQYRSLYAVGFGDATPDAEESTMPALIRAFETTGTSMDSNGHEHEIDSAAQSAGSTPWMWDGTLPNEHFGYDYYTE